MYFNISDIKTYNIDESYKQCFSNIKNSVEYSLAIDYMLERFDKNIVKEICLFLYKFKFATKKQIITIIGKKYNISIDFNFQELVDFDFFKDFILVKGFVDEEYERNEENTIYAIGPNGVNLLIEYFNIQVPRWEFRNISKSAEKVIKSLQVVDIYINMMESFKGFNIINESVGPNQRRALGDKLDIDFEWSIAGNINQNFLVLIIRDKDLKEGFNRKILKLEHFLSEKGKWRYDYIDIQRRPKVIFVCENEESVKIISRKLRGSSLNKHTLLLYTHDILLKENLLTDSKTLKKYIKETKNLKEELILSN